jgi:hypothetical protein
MRTRILRIVPVVGLFVSLYSAFFATFVLYPWHQELSDEFARLSELVLNASSARGGI